MLHKKNIFLLVFVLLMCKWVMAQEMSLPHKWQNEPFYKLYQDNKLNTISLEGTVRAVSPVPDPAKNDYDHCLYTLFVEVNSLLSKIKPDTKIANEIIVTVPIMKDKKILHKNKFSIGDKIFCVCTDYASMPQAIQEIQVSDSIQSYEHQQYYSLGIRKIQSFSKKGNRKFSKRTITVLPIKTLPADSKAAGLRKKHIQTEIVRIENELNKHGGSFAKWKEEYNTISKKYRQLCKEEYKGWINNSYFAAGGYETINSYKTQAYINGILPYKKYLEKNNIDLIIVRIPSKWDFAARVLASDDFQENPAWVEHYYACLKNDIEIIDPMPEMWKHRFDFPMFYFYNVSEESHPFEGCSFIAAKVLADTLRRYSFPISDHPMQMKDFIIKTSQTRYFWPSGNKNFNPAENVSFKQVIRDGKTIGFLPVSSGSPFIFLSNSFFWYPLRSQGASVPAYTAFFIQHIPDWFYQDGIENSMLRNLLANRHLLSNRRAVIMVGAPNNWSSAFPPFPKWWSENLRTISHESTLDFSSPAINNLDDGSFLFSKDANGVMHISKNTRKEKGNKKFSIKILIPHLTGKNTCILRINFGINSYIELLAREPKSKKIISSLELSPGGNQYADFSIPVSKDSYTILIEFLPRISSHKFSIKNFELWYY